MVYEYLFYVALNSVQQQRELDVMESTKGLDSQFRMVRKTSFLDLPEKARFAIYSMLLVHQKPFAPLQRRRIDDYLEGNTTQNLLLRAGVRLLQTCKKISNEAAPFLYGQNSFRLRPNNVEEIPRFFNRIGTGNCSMISSLDVNFEYSQERRWRGCWCIQGDEIAFTERENRFGLVDANKFLPEYPTAGQVFFADQDVIQDLIQDIILSHKREPSCLGVYQDFPDEDYDALAPENLYDGYPPWEGIQEFRRFQVHSSDAIVEALTSLQQCCGLRRLELWLPDPQRFALGYVLLKENRTFLRLLWPLEGLSELVIHGIDELGIIAVNVERTKISKVTAELNCSRARPFLHIEAGRPNLRANPNWQVCQSDRYTITLQLQKAKTVPKDMFSQLPTEIRSLIYDYLLPCWYDGFHGASPHARFEEEDRRHPYIMLKNLSYGCQRPKARRKVRTGAAALLGVSKLLHEEAAATLYGRYTFTTTPPFGPSCSCGQTEPESRFHPDINLLIHFLWHIGPKNRTRLRHLYMGLYSFIPFRTSYTQQPPLNSSERRTFGQNDAFCSQLCTMNLEWKLQGLLTMLQGIPVLHSVTLRFSDEANSAVRYPWPQENEEEDYEVPVTPRGKHMLNANDYLKLFSQLRNLKHVEIAGCLGMTDSELFARLVDAETVAVPRHEAKPYMINERQALDGPPKDDAAVETQAVAWGWMKDRDGDYDGRSRFFVKRLTPDNMTPAVARRLWAARDMKEDMVLFDEYLDELDISRQ